VLNAKNHEREAFIVAQAGRKGAVTVSTNMAGRGTDILLGGNPEFMAKEFLPRKQGKDPDAMPRRSARPRTHEWDQVFGRTRRRPSQEHDEVVSAGRPAHRGHRAPRLPPHRQPASRTRRTPGRPRQFALLSLAAGRPAAHLRWRAMQNLMLRLGMEEDVPIESKLITKRIAAAQKAVEAQNFSARKHILEYDDVMNKQRKAIYGWRRQLLEGRTRSSASWRSSRTSLAPAWMSDAPKTTIPNSGIGPACRTTSSPSSV
jgi:preprotein translocase subunit SecA